jgi:predicted phage baseplate assembly protein
VPGSILGAWASQPDLKPLWIAGSTPGTGLTFHRIDADSEHERIEPPFPESSLPVAFEPPPDGAPGAVPAARIATAEPRLFLPEPQGYVEIAEPVGIGFSTNPHRHFLRVGEHLVVQRAEPGLLYRRSRKEPGLDRFAVQVRERIAAIEAADVPGDLFAIRKSDEPGQRESFRFAAADGYRFVKLPEEGGALPNADEVEFVAVAGATGGTVRRSGSRLILTAEGGDIQDPDPLFILLRRERAGEVTEDYGAWELRRRSSGADWAVPPGFPSEMEGLRFTLLERQQVDLIEAVRPADLAAVQEPMQSGPLRPANRPSWTIPGLVAFEGFQYLILPLGQVVDGQLELLSPPQRWSELGPDRPANPGLSWEYWNGTAWWALGRGALVDGTASFQQNGEVFFTVPKDLEPTDVAGRKSHWIRARLVGGDYGEAKVTVLTRPGAVAGTTEQVATRDVGTVRAPFVTSLKLGYCLEEPVRPQLVLTEDNLGFIDQTSANEAGLEFPVFTPVSEIMNPAPAPDKPASDDDSGRCGDPCPPPAPETDPCAAPGAWESCDSPCLPHGAGRRSADGAAPAGFTRGLMIGFERAFAGETVSLHVDAASGSGSVELAAEILRDGRFVPATIVSDESHGLSESGIVTLSLPAPPDRAEMLGASAHWLRLRPKSDGGSWAPRLYGVRLNAVIARALETREMERVGSSIGLPDHEFRLAESPVAPDMLELRIRERLSAEERDEQGLDVVAFPDGPAGDWVRWARVDELTERDGPQRAFTLDPERGILRFGDGKAGRIPPPGAEIMAVRYAKVTGASANGIRAGAELQLMAPLAGVDTVVALDESAGGADAETSEGALRRAPAKIRHGGRILTLADLEEWGKGAVPGVAQLVAERRRGSVRLILAMAGGDPRPSQAQLRAVAAAARIVSSYGLARPGGLSVVAPRLLAIGVEVELEARRPELFAEAAEQARAALARLFDAATGGHGGTGWPIGRLPDEQDVAAALSPIEPLAFATALRLFRRGGRGAADESLPPSIPSDVLVRLDPADVAVARAREAAA